MLLKKVLIYSKIFSLSLQMDKIQQLLKHKIRGINRKPFLKKKKCLSKQNKSKIQEYMKIEIQRQQICKKTKICLTKQTKNYLQCKKISLKKFDRINIEKLKKTNVEIKLKLQDQQNNSSDEEVLKKKIFLPNTKKRKEIKKLQKYQLKSSKYNEICSKKIEELKQKINKIFTLDFNKNFQIINQESREFNNNQNILSSKQIKKQMYKLSQILKQNPINDSSIVLKDKRQQNIDLKDNSIYKRQQWILNSNDLNGQTSQKKQQQIIKKANPFKSSLKQNFLSLKAIIYGTEETIMKKQEEKTQVNQTINKPIYDIYQVKDMYDEQEEIKNLNSIQENFSMSYAIQEQKPQFLQTECTNLPITNHNLLSNFFQISQINFKPLNKVNDMEEVSNLNFESQQKQMNNFFNFSFSQPVKNMSNYASKRSQLRRMRKRKNQERVNY